ncbi:MAG TPA: HNH endonuclease [Candidatus Ruania gallistercoris]|uniref:HNH endonuclease n=1 Tax=Candidatus Ruania gallistercoris TaxID=2838746 RepID=A0A9D2J5W9_9MICO|nr:HNH endonuclease [Candidatus Ruania gallistercoris]
MTDLTTATDTLRASPLGELLEADLPTRLAALEALCDAVSSGDIQDERDQHTGPELGQASVRVHRACARLTGKRYQWLAVEETDGLWAASAFHPRTYASHVAHTHAISYRNASQMVRLARQLRDDIPRFGAALRAGTIGPDHVHAFASTALTSPTRIAALDEPVELEDAPGTGADGDHAPGSTPSPGQDGAQDEEDGSDHATTGSVSVETFLLTQARDLRPEKVRQLGKYFAHVADPEADERGYSKAKEREFVELVRTLDGWHLSGFLTEENGRLVRAAMDAVMTLPAPDDHRTADQRRAQALADLAHLVLDQGLAGTHASIRPHLGVLIGPEDFKRLLREAGTTRNGPGADRGSGSTSRTTTTGSRDHSSCPSTDTGHTEPASTATSGSTGTTADPPTPERCRRPEPDPSEIDWATRFTADPPSFDDGTGPVPPGLLRRLAGCGDVYRVLFSPEGEVINLGRSHRLFTPAQRRALIARDRGCTWPGCTAPPAICESHHARVHWADGGPTDLSNGALLCYHHHELVDTRSITMTRQGGIWIFTRPDGTTINTDLSQTTERQGWPDTG